MTRARLLPGFLLAAMLALCATASPQTRNISTLPRPVLLEPQNNANRIDPSVTFRWRSVAGATSYRFQCATNSAFSPCLERLLADTSSAVVCSYETQWVWRVMAMSAADTSLWSDVWTFLTRGATPGGFDLIGPSGDNIPLNTEAEWDGDGNPNITYTLQLDWEPSFTPPLYLDVSGQFGDSYPLRNLSEGTTFYWRVQAKNREGAGPRMGPVRFTTIALLHGAWLILPEDSSSGVPPDTTLFWAPVLGADSYRVQVATDTGFAARFADSSGITGTTLNISGLERNRRYWWRVQGFGTNGAGHWSGAYNFITRPAPPLLHSPADGSAIGPVPDTLVEWVPVAGAHSYTVEVARDSLFRVPFDLADSVGCCSYRVLPLTNRGSYHWRVKTAAAGGESEWSAAWSFTGGLPVTADAPRMPLSCAIVGIYPSPVRDEAIVVVSAAGDGSEHTVLRISDATGRAIATLLDERLAPGEHRIPVSTRRLPAGLYVITMQRGVAHGMRMMLVLH